MNLAKEGIGIWSRKVLKSFRKLKIDLGSEMKFESGDLNSNHQARFWLKGIPNSERFKLFQTRKSGIWLKDSNSNQQLQTKDILKFKARTWISK
jgi:hypothetical protein